MGKLIAFPGVDLAAIRPNPTCIEDLPAGAKALVVIEDGAGFAVVMRPALNDKDRSIRVTFTTARAALQYARRTAACCPALYQLVIDETEVGRRSLERILGPGRDPMGVEGWS